MAVASPLLVLTSGRAITTILVGTGETSAGFSLLDLTRVHGPLLFALSRFLPIGLAMLVAWWAAQVLGPALFEPIPLVALVALWLSFRLVFEVNVWGYYFMAIAVALVLLDVIRGRIRVSLLIWLALVALAVAHGLAARATGDVLPVWLWQLILVSGSISLALKPLFVFTTGHKTG
jgi:hypothetical protein